MSGYRETLDCLKRFRARAAKDGAPGTAELDAIDSEVLALIDEVTAAARAAPMPPLEDLTTDVYINY